MLSCGTPLFNLRMARKFLYDLPNVIIFLNNLFSGVDFKPGNQSVEFELI
jgi:hypothetical protein